MIVNGCFIFVIVLLIYLVCVIYYLYREVCNIRNTVFTNCGRIRMVELNQQRQYLLAPTEQKQIHKHESPMTITYHSETAKNEDASIKYSNVTDSDTMNIFYLNQQFSPNRGKSRYMSNSEDANTPPTEKRKGIIYNNESDQIFCSSEKEKDVSIKKSSDSLHQLESQSENSLRPEIHRKKIVNEK